MDAAATASFPPMTTEHHIPVQRTARYYVLGDAGPRTREVWFVLHGYGQLASRFIGYCDALRDDARLVVAPEALNRFYTVAPTDRNAAARPVGATWMTREDRERDIADYVAYLDDVYAHVMQPLDRGAVRVCVLGFSQGTATAARWLARSSRVRADELVLWGGLLPPELELATARAELGAPVTLVIGTRDQFADETLVRGEEARLAAAGIRFRVRRFDGGHMIDGPTLAVVANEPLDATR